MNVFHFRFGPEQYPEPPASNAGDTPSLPTNRLTGREFSFPSTDPDYPYHLIHQPEGTPTADQNVANF
jgi:hypothetical protein